MLKTKTIDLYKTDPEFLKFNNDGKNSLLLSANPDKQSIISFLSIMTTSFFLEIAKHYFST